MLPFSARPRTSIALQLAVICGYEACPVLRQQVVRHIKAYVYADQRAVFQLLELLIQLLILQDRLSSGVQGAEYNQICINGIQAG
ncbi:hypothetical protein D3C80_1569740 [compost metagenome]